MLRARDFRQMARNALANKWWLLILIALVALVLGGTDMIGGFSAPVSENVYYDYSYGSPYYYDYNYAYNMGSLILLNIIALISIGIFIVGGAVNLGYCRINIKLQRRENVAVSDLFSHFHIFGRALLLRLFMTLFVFLWTLVGVGPLIIIVTIIAVAIAGAAALSLYSSLLMMPFLVFLIIIAYLAAMIPGIIAYYRYAMAPYLMSENPSLGVRQAVDISKQMMKGHVKRLFCLDISFIGWALLAGLAISIVSALFAWIFSFSIVLATIFIIAASFAAITPVIAYRSNARAAFFLDLNYHFQNYYRNQQPAQVNYQQQAPGYAPANAPQQPPYGQQPQYNQQAPQYSQQPQYSQPVPPPRPDNNPLPPYQQPAPPAPAATAVAPPMPQPTEQTPIPTTSAPAAETVASSPAETGGYYDHQRQRFIPADNSDPTNNDQ